MSSDDPNQTVDELGRGEVPLDSGQIALTQIGRYRIERVLGKGGFGLVYLAHDEQLNRLVAVKVPHRTLVSRPEDADAYLIEARTVANLDHPNIVPVYDAGSTEQFPCFVVSKYIDGTDLAARLKQSRLSIHESIELTATVAEALHHAHKHGLVHRDIKPGNILLDTNGKPFVADFGLALREQEVGTGPRFAGTPAYMSPEQARGEGHRVDGRSDVFSLGLVLYELLTGRRAFQAESLEKLRERIANTEVRPPRQWDDAIPKELERICLKALVKRASERYTTAKDLADDLWHYFSQATDIEKRSLPSGAPNAGTHFAPPATTPFPSTKPTPSSDSPPLKIVPKGLRSFDAHDADFFLELLPGPRDRDGLPDGIRFWKTHIEETDAESTFSVGLVYGPSGCGKSSLVKAGLLPHLSRDVMTVYVEAAVEETEARLLNGLRKCCPDLPGSLRLKATLAALRRGQGVPLGKKVLIVLDQFEQWLHANKEEENTELVQALRQCDGGRVQCLVMVRDDFWMAATRFLRDLEVRLLEGQNSAAVDLFDLDHAKRILSAFGRALGKLPDKASDATKEQKEFLKQAVSGLAREGKVICVRLALFAEMMKGKSWTPATLKAVGGAEGVGVTFLEETFSAATAPLEHRYHQKAARAVLKALLPEASTDIKGHMRSQEELRQASGYASRPRDFEDLLSILDSGIRLITPTDPEGMESVASGSPAHSGPPPNEAGQRYYQLTHDYLVHSLREWLTRKQKETRRGRAELLLADRAAVWNARPENRQLPSVLQWLQIRWLTDKRNWTPPQRKMMGKATRFYVLQAAMVGVLFILIGWGVYEGRGSLQAHALRQRLLDADINEVPAIVRDMTPYRRWLDPLLRNAYAQADKDNDHRKKLHSALALLPVDASQASYLTDRLLDAEPGEVSVLRDSLLPHQEQLRDKLWAIVEAPDKGKGSQRLRAAAALAKYDPASAKWSKCCAVVIGDLVRENPVFLLYWSKAFQPVKNSLLESLTAIFRDPQPERTAERSLAANLLADYAADQPNMLTELLLDAGEKQFVAIYAKVKDRSEQYVPALTGEIDKELPPDLASSDVRREKLAKRQANAAVALLRMNQVEKVWPLLKHSSDPMVRSYLIHRLRPLGADAEAIVKRLDEEPDITIRRALILSLGEFGDKDLPDFSRRYLLPRLHSMYRSEADPGLHAALEWLLRQWKEKAWLQQVNEEWAKDTEQQRKRLQGIQQHLAKDKEKPTPQWYVNGQGQTMVVIPGPVEFLMGSPTTEAGWNQDETQHRRRIGRTFAVAAKPVTAKEFRRFLQANKLEAWFEGGGLATAAVKRYGPEEDGPVITVDWHRAVAYCNWLSEQEGIPPEQWCYETTALKLKQKSVCASAMMLMQRHPLAAAGVSSYLLVHRSPQVTGIRKNYLSLTGYRLPTEAEMEYATRAGSLTSRYYGESEELLPKYAWYYRNAEQKAWPAGLLKPNDLGLFDTLGNVYAWCQERYNRYPGSPGEKSIEDKEDIYSINDESFRALHGSHFYMRGRAIRSANRYRFEPTQREIFIGFRPARTCR